MAESRVTSLSLSMPRYMDQDLAREPGLFDANEEFATRRGGPVTRAFLDRIPTSWRNDLSLTIDVWTVEVRPGWFPCHPAWTRNQGEHLVGRVNGELAPVEFAEGTYNLGHHELEEGVDQLVMARQLRLWVPDPRKFYSHNGYAIHRCLPARAAGWTWTGRATLDRRTTAHANEIVRRSKVYIR